MSTYWNIRCVTCSSTHGFDCANHREDLMCALIKHASAIAGLAPLRLDTPDAPIRTPWGEVDVDWFATHHLHELVPIDEYGVLLGQCYLRVPCSHCGVQQARCRLSLGHEGSCES